MQIRLGIAIYLCSVLAAQADPVEGLWKTKPDDNGNYGHVLIQPCGPAFCGVLDRSFAADFGTLVAEAEGVVGAIVHSGSRPKA